jgi:tripartite-type tricarboxylate transporter receptor subunit TctC
MRIRQRLLCATFAASQTVTGAVQAQEWPSKSVRVVNPGSVGGVSDMMARTIAQHFTTTFGHTFVVDNRPGANGLIGLEIVARSPPDGYTLLAASSGMLVMNSPMVGNSAYDSTRLAPVVANPRSLPARTWAITVPMPLNAMFTCPASKSTVAGAAPLYGI